MTEIYLSLASLLLVLWLLSTITGKWAKRFARWKSMAILIPAALIITLFPVNGISLSQYILSANPIFSIGSTALLFVLVIRRLSGKDLVSQREMVIFAVWNIVLGLVLYSSALGLTDYDIYRFGYGSPAVFFIFVLLTIILLILRSSLGIIFIACIGAFDLGILGSGNFFDYMIDGPLFLLSCGILIDYGVKKMAHPAMINGT